LEAHRDNRGDSPAHSLLHNDGAVQHVHPTGERDVSRIRRRELDHHQLVERSARLMFRDGNITSVPHVLSVVRTNVMRAGMPARNVTFAGS
jgi:hypothetical protein